MAINTGRVGGAPSEGPRPERKAQTTPSSEVAKKTFSNPPATPPQGGVRGLAKFWEAQASSNKPTAPPPRKLPAVPSRSAPAEPKEVKPEAKTLSAADKEKLLKAREEISSLRGKMAEIKKEHAQPAQVSKAPTEAPSRSKAEMFKEKSQAFHAKAQQAKSNLQNIKARHEELKSQAPKMQERLRPLPPTPSPVAKAPVAAPPKAPAAPPLEQHTAEQAPAMSMKKAPTAKTPSAPDRGNLLSDIQKGVQLKSSQERPVSAPKSDPNDLKSHLTLRRQSIEDDEDDDEGMQMPSSVKTAPARPAQPQMKAPAPSRLSDGPPPPPPSQGAPKTAPAPKGKDFLSEIKGKGVADLKKAESTEHKQAAKPKLDRTDSFNKSMLQKAQELEKQVKSDLPDSSDDEWGD